MNPKKLAREFIKAHPEQEHNGCWYPNGSMWDPRSFPNEAQIRLAAIIGIHYDEKYFGSYELTEKERELQREYTKEKFSLEERRKLAIAAYHEADTILTALWESQPIEKRISPLHKIFDELNFQDENQ